VPCFGADVAGSVSSPNANRIESTTAGAATPPTRIIVFARRSPTAPLDLRRRIAIASSSTTTPKTIQEPISIAHQRSAISCAASLAGSSVDCFTGAVFRARFAEKRTPKHPAVCYYLCSA
jgi:hypothetical protein